MRDREREKKRCKRTRVRTDMSLCTPIYIYYTYISKCICCHRNIASLCRGVRSCARISGTAGVNVVQHLVSTLVRLRRSEKRRVREHKTAEFVISSMPLRTMASRCRWRPHDDSAGSSDADEDDDGDDADDEDDNDSINDDLAYTSPPHRVVCGGWFSVAGCVLHVVLVYMLCM